MHFVHLKTSGFLRVLRTRDRIVRSNTWCIHSLLTLAVAMQAPFACGREVDAARKPNILLILADDLGWGDVGDQSEGRFLTPNIDSLAREGVVFSNGYACGANTNPR